MHVGAKRRRSLAAIGAATLLGLTAIGVNAGPVAASSHREAPLISEDPVADNTDLYMFRDAVDPTKVDVLANFIGLELPAGGPNFEKFGDDVLYEIHIDSNGDAVSDTTYQFRFATHRKNDNTFLYNTGPITSPNDADQNVTQTYSVRKTTATTSTVISAASVETPPVNVGTRSTPNYDKAFQTSFVAPLTGGGSVFAGQVDDPFFVDLGSVFDLLGLRGLNGAHVIPKPTQAGVDGLYKKNVHTIALRLPITELLGAGASPACTTATTTTNDKSCVIGAFASSSRARIKVQSADGTAPRNLGRFVQVSRLALPLVNEVLVPLGKKDLFNATVPTDDGANIFANVLDPEPAKLIPVLYPGATTPPGGFNADGSPKRTDIVAVLQGAGAGLSGAQLLPPADLLRLNVTTPVTSAANFNRLGVIAGDGGGFPNGRRLADDVVDVDLRLLAGGTPLNADGYNKSPNNILGDDVNSSADSPLQTTFPYVGLPTSGYCQPGAYDPCAP